MANLYNLKGAGTIREYQINPVPGDGNGLIAIDPFTLFRPEYVLAIMSFDISMVSRPMQITSQVDFNVFKEITIGEAQPDSNYTLQMNTEGDSETLMYDTTPTTAIVKRAFPSDWRINGDAGGIPNITLTIGNMQPLDHLQIFRVIGTEWYK